MGRQRQSDNLSHGNCRRCLGSSDAEHTDKVCRDSCPAQDLGRRTSTCGGQRLINLLPGSVLAFESLWFEMRSSVLRRILPDGHEVLCGRLLEICPRVVWPTGSIRDVQLQADGIVRFHFWIRLFTIRKEYSPVQRILLAAEDPR